MTNEIGMSAITEFTTYLSWYTLLKYQYIRVSYKYKHENCLCIIIY